MVATNRHISCGALELKDVSWEDNKLDGESELVANDNYIIYVTEPEGFTFSEVICEKEIDVRSELKNGIREIHLKSIRKDTVKWEIFYSK